jgi:excisionase family DNA binding protein
MPVGVPVIEMADRLTEALLAQCQRWRIHGWNWWPTVHNPPAPQGFAWSAPPHPQHAVRKQLAHGDVGGLCWEIRAEAADTSGVSVEAPWVIRVHQQMTFGRVQPKPLPHTDGHLLVVLQYACPPARPRRLLVVVALDGMPQDDRREWRKLLRWIREPGNRALPEERPPRVSWSKFFRDGEALRCYGPRQLYVGKPLSSQTRQEIMAHLLIYAWQAQMSARGDVTPWLSEYIRAILPRVSSDDVSYLLEELLKSFALPVDAHGVRAHLRHLHQMQQRQGGVDRRLVRGLDVAGDSGDLNKAASDALARHLPRGEHHRSLSMAEASSSEDALLSLSLSQTAAYSGLTRRQLGYMIEEGKINAIRRGRYWRIPLAAVEHLGRQHQGEALRKALTLLRARIQGGQYDSARRWLDRQLAAGRLPRDIFGALCADLQGEEWPELCTRIRQLLEARGPETGWDV